MDRDDVAARVRREPPTFVPVTVEERIERTPRALHLVLAGDGIRAMAPPGIAASVRLLVPSPGDDGLVVPEWHGNEFLRADGSRPVLRTFTPLDVDRVTGRLGVTVVRHPGGAVAGWAEACAPGDPAAVSGFGRGWEFDPGTTRLLVFGDETALPAVGQVLGSLPDEVPAEVHVEIETAAAAVAFPARDRVDRHWHVRADGAAPGAALVAAAADIATIDDTTHVWAAGEAASMQAIRRHLFDVAGADRRQCTIRGYWKPARR